MARALDLLVVIKVLLDGGYISSTHYVQRRTEYKVHQRQSTKSAAHQIGHITEKQFEALVGLGIIKPIESSPTDKWRNTTNFYELKKER